MKKNQKPLALPEQTLVINGRSHIINNQPFNISNAMISYERLHDIAVVIGEEDLIEIGEDLEDILSLNPNYETTVAILDLIVRKLKATIKDMVFNKNEFYHLENN